LTDQPTRKFDFVRRSDLNDIPKGQISARPATCRKTAAAGLDDHRRNLLLVTTVDDFQEYVETATFEGTGRSSTSACSPVGGGQTI